MVSQIWALPIFDVSSVNQLEKDGESGLSILLGSSNDQMFCFRWDIDII